MNNVIRFNLLKFRTNLLLKSNTAKRANVPYTDASSIGIIFSVEDKIKHETIKQLIKRFEQDGKKVKVLEFLPKKKDNYEFRFDFFTEDELTFWGKIDSPDALKFAESPFDFLLYLDKTPNPLILHILALSKSKCRVGKSWSDGQPFFELMIESGGDIKMMSETMYNYTSQLR